MRFTEIESRLLALKAEGLTDAEAGKELGYSRRWVEDTLATMRRRLGVATTTQAVAEWMRFHPTS